MYGYYIHSIKKHCFKEKATSCRFFLRLSFFFYKLMNEIRSKNEGNKDFLYRE